jgi:hypothetical protein
MTTLRQFEANRRNALGSTGLRTEEGKRASRRNALRHGLTAETVIDGLEDSEDYRGFEASVISDYDAQTAVQRELVLRLASPLWRLRRIISIETDLLRIQSEILRDRRGDIGRFHNELQGRSLEDTNADGGEGLSLSHTNTGARELTYCFPRVANLDNGVFERLGRYKVVLWKQTAQTLLLLGPIRRRYE